VTVDKAAFDAAMAGQRDKARAGSAFGGKKGEQFGLTPEHTPHLVAVGDHFDGYGATRVTGVPVVALFDEQRQAVDALATGQIGYLALARTPFYLESGGQVSDVGHIVDDATGARAEVEGLARIRTGLPRAHRVRVTSGELRVRDLVTAEVDADVRDATRRNHTATHLLHAALRQVLGSHVKQAGSLVSPDRLRFDFVHFQAITRAELDRIERIVNEQICRNTAVTTEVRSTQEAIAAGAMALFGEKYGDEVRVVSVPGFSLELCGGTHVKATGDIGFFAIVGESGVAAGTRRIEALTGAGAVGWAQHQRAMLASVVEALHVTDTLAVDAIERLQAESKKLTREVAQLKTKIAMGGGPAAGDGDDTTEVAGVRLARRKVSDMDKDDLRGLSDSLKAKIKSGVVIVASANEGKVQIVVSVTSDLTGRVKAGQIVKEIAPIVGGAGGGRPDFAEAGGKEPAKIDDMLEASQAVLARLLA
jgi:alanyl-tRNA synthetase